MTARHLAFFLILFSPALWSANYLVARWVADWFPPYELAFSRWTVALIPMLVISGKELWRHRKIAWAERWDLLLIASLGLWLGGAFMYIAARTVTATNMSFIWAGSPILITLLSAAMYRERLTAARLVGVILGFTGVAVIVGRGNPLEVSSLTFGSGDLWVLSAAVAWAMFTLMLSHRPTALSNAVRLAAIMIAGLLVLLPFTVAEAIAEGLPPLEPRTAIAAAIIGLLPGFAAFRAYAWLTQHVGPVRSGVIFYLVPVYTALLEGLLFGEAINLYHVVSAMLVFTGVYLTSRRAHAHGEPLKC